MKLNRLILMTAIACMACQAAFAADEKKTESSETAIRAANHALADAYNQGDAKTLASYWCEKGEWISPSGERIIGRETIEKTAQTLFLGKRQGRLELLESKIRFLTEEVAIEEGFARLFPSGDPSENFPGRSSYMAMHVFQNGQWLLDTVRAMEPSSLPIRETPLKALEWMIGKWEGKKGETATKTSVAWTKGKAFLICRFNATIQGVDEMEGTQMIGWDPTSQTIRSWIFDSHGDFGEGQWTREGDRWTVQSTLIFPDGTKSSATNLFTHVDNDNFTWESSNRQVDGSPMPNLEAISYVRMTDDEADSEDSETVAKKDDQKEEWEESENEAEVSGKDVTPNARQDGTANFVESPAAEKSPMPDGPKNPQ